ncbi:MAG: hypothetical protein HY471_01165 [Candidatus Sungbacteria bacterium]|nr:hypothetical protein [Candidatus Sungbacteria bacterium]
MKRDARKGQPAEGLPRIYLTSPRVPESVGAPFKAPPPPTEWDAYMRERYRRDGAIVCAGEGIG